MKTAALVACSNALSENERNTVNQLKEILSSLNIKTVESPYLYAGTVFTMDKGSVSCNSYASGNARERAEILNHFYQDNSIDAIFDLSGGDMANEVLPYLDFQAIGKSNKLFYGYSDLTAILNAIHTKTGRSSMLFQIKNLVWDETGIQQKRFRDYLSGGHSLQTAEWTFLQGKDQGILQSTDYSVLQGSGDVESMLKNHIVLGGNVRCFLKLAGTPYFPNLDHKILFLESLGGGVPQISTYMAQLNQLGVFEKVSAVLLGTFTEMEREEYSPGVYEIMKQYLPEDLPVAQTSEIGHGKQSKALEIGGTIR